MIKAFVKLLRGDRKHSREYSGLSDFFLHAPIDKKKKIIREAAYKANEDQRRTFEEAKLKLKQIKIS